MQRFNTISFFPSSMAIEQYNIPAEPNGDYIVDTSAFIPTSEALKQLQSGALGNVNLQGLYDFANGKDNGKKIPVDRTHSYTGDIAEMSVAVAEQRQNVIDGIIDAKDKYDKDMFKKQLRNDIANSNNTNANANSSTNV